MNQMDQLKFLENFDFESFDLVYVWKKWREEIIFFFDLVIKIDEKERKVKFFLYFICLKGWEIYEIMQFGMEKNDRIFDELIQLFGEYCDLKKNEIVERYKVFIRNQELGEIFDKYFIELRFFEKICDFGILLDFLFRDRIVCGLFNFILRERLFREFNFNLK